MNWLLETDKSFFLFVNGLHTPFMDKVMLFFTSANTWIPLYIVIALYIVYRYAHKERSLLYALLIIILVILTFAFTDLLSAQMKEWVQRFRPGHDPALEGMVRLLEGKGGLYGFPSSHAANVFGFATITAFTFKRKLYSIVIYLWAATVSYSRLYVGKHFLLDVLCGALLGLLLGLLLYEVIDSKWGKELKKK